MGKKKRDPYNFESWKYSSESRSNIPRTFFGLESKYEARGEFSGNCVDYEMFAAKTRDQKAETWKKLTNFFVDSRRFDDVNSFKGGKCY